MNATVLTAPPSKSPDLAPAAGARRIVISLLAGCATVALLVSAPGVSRAGDLQGQPSGLRGLLPETGVEHRFERSDRDRAAISLTPTDRSGLFVPAIHPPRWAIAYASHGELAPDVRGFTVADPLRVEVTLAAPLGGLDVGLAHRTALTADRIGRLESSGAEVRIGQRLDSLVGDAPNPTWDKPAWYLFAASDGEALTWKPRLPGLEARSLSVQERVTVGDMQAGVSLEANGMQASFTYIQREVSNGQRSEDQSHVGLSLTWRR